MIRKISRNLLFVWLLFACSRLQADHLPPSKMAQGKPEHVLAETNVYDGKIASVIQHLGKPDKVTSTTNADYPAGSGERSYEWNRSGVRLRVGTEFRTDDQTKEVIESAPMIIDVWGEQKGTFGSTGKGLVLGDNLAAIRKVYGPRFQTDPHSITVQWRDETTLVIDLNRAGRIVHMQLLAATE
jgi:hypothetical protein